MRERPILFSAPMVRAILAGTKTQTRRLVKPQPREQNEITSGHGELAWQTKPGHFIVSTLPTAPKLFIEQCPYGQPGDRLWVREAHWMDRRDTTLAVMNVDGFVVAQNGRETGRECNPEELGLNHYWKMRPSIHMPRWASRILLEIVSVRVDRLQAISRGDSMAEGCPFQNMAGGPDPTQWYADLWQQINGPGSWDTNPWVWVVEFKRVTK